MVTRKSRHEMVVSHGSVNPPMSTKIVDFDEAYAGLTEGGKEVVDGMKFLGWTVNRLDLKKRWWIFQRETQTLRVREREMTLRWMENVCRPREADLDSALRMAFRHWRIRKFAEVGRR